MTQHPLFPDPPAVTATVTVNVTQEHPTGPQPRACTR